MMFKKYQFIPYGKTSNEIQIVGNVRIERSRQVKRLHWKNNKRDDYSISQDSENTTAIKTIQRKKVRNKVHNPLTEANI